MMILSIIDKILMVLFFMATLNTIRHGYYFIQTVLISQKLQDNEEPLKYNLSWKSLLLLGVSIAYILTVIFTGVKI